MEYTVTVGDKSLHLETTSGLFSPEAPDRGTLAMLSCIELNPGQRVLDLGCGCGLVGIYAAQIVGAENVIMCDIDPEAVEIARKNAESNGCPQIQTVVSDAYDSLDCTGLDWILSNPPYHTDFSVVRRFIEKGFNRLAIGGRLVMVTKRLDWYKNKLTAIFGGVRVREIDGYYVFIAEKRSGQYANTKVKAKSEPSAKLRRKAFKR